jgi:hypothetical protein
MPPLTKRYGKISTVVLFDGAQNFLTGEAPEQK